MPLAAVAINSFDATIMRDPKHNNDLSERIAKLYDSYRPTAAAKAAQTDVQNNVQNNDPVDAQNIMAMFAAAFDRGDVMYVGMFNDKPIAAVGCFDDGQTDSKRLQYLAIHPENCNRGIEAKFIKQVYDQEVRKGVRRFMPVDSCIHQIMHDYELIVAKQWQ